MRNAWLLILAVCPVVAAAPVRPETDREKVERSWGKVVSPSSHYQVKPEGGLLTLRTIGWPEHYEFQEPKFQITREVAGDFDARVKVYDLDAPQRGVYYEYSGPNTAAGLYIAGGDCSIALYRWKAFHHINGVLQDGMQDSPWLSRRSRNGGSGSTLGEWEAGQSGYLRIVRKGEELIASVSYDGKDWKERNAAMEGLKLPYGVTISLFVGHTTSQTCSAKYADFAITTPNK